MTPINARRRWISTVTAAVLALGGLVATAGPTQADTAAAPILDVKSYTSTDRGDGTYTVPLLNSDVPDVSVEMIPAAENDEGRDIYYMISTTMHLSPGAPIMKSYDLVNWEIVNYVYDRLSVGDSFSLRNGKNEYGRGQWATSIRHHDGTWYIAFNTNNLGGSYIYKTDDIDNGSWEKIALGRAFHDPSLFFDEADGGTPYIFYGSGSTSAVKLSPDLRTVVAEYPQILRTSDYPGSSFLGGLFEGAQVTYIDGQYYIVIITWPSGQGRQVALFRSPDLLGRYTSAAGANTYEAKGVLNSSGFAQGSLVPVTAPDGSIGYHGFFFRDNFPAGRIPALIPAVWNDGWPTFGNNGSVPVNGAFAKPITLSPAETALERIKSVVASDDFTNDAPHRAYMDEEWDIPAGPTYDPSLLGVELFANPDLESGATGWVGNDTAVLTASDQARTGSGSLITGGRTTTGSGPAQDVTGKLQAGVTYTVSAWVRYDNPASPATKRFNLTVRYGASSFTNFANVTATRGQWARIQGTITPTAAQAAGSARIFVENPWVANATAQAAPAEHLMDFLIDDASIVGAAPSAEVAHPDEIAPNGSRLDVTWEWNHAPDNRYWSLTDREGWLRLTTGRPVTGAYTYDKLSGTPELTYLEEARNTLSQRTFLPQGSAEAKLDVSGTKPGDTAGLAVFGRGFSYVAVRNVGGVNTVGVVNRVAPFAATFDQAGVEAFVPGTTASLGDADEVYLKADLEMNNPAGQGWTTFYYSLDGSTWTKLGNRVGPQALDGSLAHFMGHRWGLFNYATQTAGGHVDVDYFALSDTLTAQNVPVTTTAIDTAIAQAQGLDGDRYPAEQWEALQQALAGAIAARDAGFGSHNQADAPRLVLQRQIAELALIDERAGEVEPTLDVVAVAGSRCVAGRAQPTVTVTSSEEVPVSVVVSAVGTSRTLTVAPGRSVFHQFTHRAASLPAGEVELEASATVDGALVTYQQQVAYPAASCS